MISDVLSDAAVDIQRYLTDPATKPCYQGTVKKRILAVVAIMDMVREELDTPPMEPGLLALVRAYATTYPLDVYQDKAQALIARAEGKE